MVVIKPLRIPKFSSGNGCQTVGGAGCIEIMVLARSYLFELTPRTIVMSGSLAGAEIITFQAPEVRCFSAFSRIPEQAGAFRNDIHTEFPPTRSPGYLIDVIATVLLLTSMVSSLATTVPSSAPWTGIVRRWPWFRICEVVYGDDFHLGMFQRCSEYQPSNSYQTVIPTLSHCASLQAFHHY